MRDRPFDRFYENLSRVRNLIALFRQLDHPGAGRRPTHSTDILRSAVVLLHASLEDLLRALGSGLLPAAEKDTLDHVPIFDSSGRDRARGLSLGDLSLSRGKTVDEVISEVVDDHLSRRSFSNTIEIASFLQQIGVSVEVVSPTFPELEAMISRRHHIVHQADRNLASGRGHHSTRSVSEAQVTTWLHNVEEFAAIVEDELCVE